MNLTAQIQVNLRPINPFHFTPEHCWEMDVISLKEKSFRVKVFAQILTKNHQLIAELESDVLMINKGMNSFNSLTTQTQRINYHLADYGNLVSTIGKFPSGKYTVCVNFQCLTPDCDGAGTDALLLEPNLCRDVKVELPTPLILASPFDKSEIEETRPMFTWIPPMPIGGMLELRYIYTLTEKREGQSNIDAIRRNRPIIQDQYVERPSMFYPLDIEELEYEKDYVWQVEAWYGNVYIATSEVWEFKLKEEKVEPTPHNYVKVNDGNEGIFTMTNILRFSFDSKSKEGILTYQILDSEGKEVKGIPQLERIYGENRYDLDLRDLKMKANSTYTLVIIDENGSKKRLKFKYIYFSQH